MKLHTQILVALAAALAVAGAGRWLGVPEIGRAFVALEPIGTVFIRLVSMVVIPLVIASVFVAVASLGDVGTLGRLGGWTFGYFAATTLVAAMIGAGVAGVAGVGEGVSPPPVRVEAHVEASVTAETSGEPSVGWVQWLVDLAPQNVVKAAADGDLLPLIFAVCLFGAAAATVPAARRQPLVAVLSSVNDVAMVLIAWIMRAAPVAVFLLIGATVARSGFQLIGSLAVFATVVVAALIVHAAGVLLPTLALGARIRLRAFFRFVSEALVLAFSTASSSATLPISMANAERLGVPASVVSFVLPLGSTINKNGAAVYKAATAVFLAHLYGLPLGPTVVVSIVLASSLAAFAGAGVPGSSLVTTLIVLNAIGLGADAAAGIALVAGIDRPLDMCRTTVNTLGNLVGAAYVARRTGAAAS